MYTVRVIPVARGTTAEELTYFSPLEYSPGAVIVVPMRGREVGAVVIGCEAVRMSKATLKTSDFALRKIPRQSPHTIVLPEFVRAAERTARYHAATTGAVLFSFLPKALLELEEAPPPLDPGARPRLRGFIVPRLYQGLAEHRIDFYRTSVREAFAAGGSVLLVTPTVADAEHMVAALAGGIERHAYLLHGSLTRVAQAERIKAILASEHPVLVVVTPSFLSLPRRDLATIIVEREASSLYRTRTRPFVDVRIFAHDLAAELGGQLFLADLPLRVDSIYRRELGEYEEVVSGHHRTHFATPARLIDLKGESRPPKAQFRAIGRELLECIEQAGSHGGRVFLYVARRGLSPVTVCGDCGTAVTCHECGASVVLHKGNEENYFLCHACGALRHARERCARCHSWRLEALGIGTELVERELAEYFPDRRVVALSSDTARTHTAAKRIITAFYEEPRALLVGTELALPYLSKHVPIVGVVSLDSLLSLASWNIYERIASSLTRLRELAGEELVVQTRRPEADILSTVLSGNFSGFYRSELKARKKLGYPPFTVIIKVSVTGSQAEIARRMEEAVALLAPYELITFSRTLRAPKGKFTLHGFVRIARESWPNEDLLAKLRALSPAYTVIVDPDSIL